MAVPGRKLLSVAYFDRVAAFEIQYDLTSGKGGLRQRMVAVICIGLKCGVYMLQISQQLPIAYEPHPYWKFNDTAFECSNTVSRMILP